MKKTISYILIAAILATSFCSCGKGESQISGEPTVSMEDWKTEGFAVSGSIVEEQGLWVESHVKLEHEEVDWDEDRETLLSQIYPLESVAFVGKLYTLYPVAGKPEFSVTRGFLEIIDLSTFETVTEALSAEQMGIREGENDSSIVGGIDVLGEGRYVLEIAGYRSEEDEILQPYDDFIYLGPEGVERSVDLQSAYQESGVRDDKDQFSAIVLGTGECRLDAAGNSYVRAGEGSNQFQSLYVFSPEGKFLKEYAGENETYVGEPARTGEGELVFPVYDRAAHATRLVWYDGETAEFHVLAQLEGESFLRLFGMQGNLLYYDNRDGIVRWDVASGERKLVFRYDENGVSGYSAVRFYVQDEVPPVLKITYTNAYGQGEDWLAVLSEEPVERPEAVRVASLAGETPWRPRLCVYVAARMHPDYVYVYQDAGSQNREDFRTRVVAEMVAGGGPDLLCVSLEDMELLQKQGLLSDLRELLPEETLARVLPGVIQMGTVDGTLTGLAAGVRVESLSIGTEVWAEDSWSWEELLSLMEEGKVDNRYGQSGSLFASFAAMNLLLEYSLEDSFLIDWEEGESHFEDERFVRMMEVLGRYNPEPLEAEEITPANRIKSEGAFYLQTIASFTGIHGNGDRHYVGYPTEEGHGSYLTAYGGVVVANRNLSNPEAVSAYLETLLGDEVQFDASNIDTPLPVVPLSEDSIRYHVESPDCEDGSTYVERVNELVALCVPAPRKYVDLYNIYYEELNAYYFGANGDKTAREVAKIIDNRVQLYLDEHGAENVR